MKCKARIRKTIAVQPVQFDSDANILAYDLTPSEFPRL